MQDYMKEIADKIAEQRKLKGWTQKELADKLSVSDKTVSKWECARSVPDIFYLKSLSQLFEKDIDYFVGDDDAVALSRERERQKIAFECRVWLGAGLLLSLVSLLICTIARLFMPETIPCHYDAHGNITRWGSSAEIVTLGLTFSLVTAVAFVIMYAVSRRFADGEFTRATLHGSGITFAAMSILFIVLTVNFVVKANSLGLQAGYLPSQQSKFAPLFAIVLNAVYAFVSALCIFVKRNPLLGVRLAFTMKSDRIWNFVNFWFGVVAYATSFICIALAGYIRVSFAVSMVVAFLPLVIDIAAVVFCCIYASRKGME